MDSRRRQLLQGLVSVGLGVWPGCSRDDETQSSAPASPIALSKHPYVQLVGERSARLRFETRIDTALAVVVRTGDGSLERTPERTTRDVTYARNFLADNPDFHADEPGLCTLHELRVDDLEPGVRYHYTIEADEPVEGSFMAPPAPGGAHVVGWLADTSFPFSLPSVAVLEAAAPQLVVHGGDLQYQASPFDTWNGHSLALSPLTSRAFTHFCVGNHEQEDGDELEQMFDRLYGGQGGSTTRYFAFTFGGVRWICLDSETVDLGADAPQLDWLQTELSAASTAVAQTIVAFHRPVYSLSKHYPSSTATRDALHPLFVEHGVRLVLCGHAHCYERFVVDGIHYVVDGGGGAVLYDPDEDREQADRQRPGESDLRVAVSKSHGATVIAVDEAGALSVERHDTDDGLTDSFVVEAG